MTQILDSLTAALSAPTPTSLWRLRGDLLQSGVPQNSALWQTLEAFHQYLSLLSASMTAHDYSRLATLLDIGAIGGLALGNVLETYHSPEELWKRLLVGGASESLMVLASRQYVKAFQSEIGAVYRSAAWRLYDDLWRLSMQLQPDLAAEIRREQIDALLEPVHDHSLDNTVKAVIIGLLYQMLLLIHVKAGRPDLLE